MSDAVTLVDRGQLAPFEPRAALTADAKTNAIIEYAQRTKDWQLLERAVDQKMEDQREFVQWWRDEVTPNKGGDRKSDQTRGTGLLICAKAEELTGITHQQVSKWAKRLQDESKYRELLYGAAYRKAFGEEHNHRAVGTGENEWYTPPQYIAAAREALGEIDLDPASSWDAQKIVGAANFFTKKENGLAREWFGRVWLNPPYTQPDIQQFAEKMVGEVRSERVSAAIMLTHNYTDTAWFHHLESACSRICFTRGRIKFINKDGELAAPTQGQAFFYFGGRAEAFRDAFIPYGFVR